MQQQEARRNLLEGEGIPTGGNKKSKCIPALHWLDVIFTVTCKHLTWPAAVLGAMAIDKFDVIEALRGDKPISDDLKERIKDKTTNASSLVNGFCLLYSLGNFKHSLRIIAKRTNGFRNLDKCQKGTLLLATAVYLAGAAYAMVCVGHEKQIEWAATATALANAAVSIVSMMSFFVVRNARKSTAMDPGDVIVRREGALNPSQS